MADSVTFRVDGVKELARDLRKLGDADLKAALRDANKGIADAVVTRALPFVPVRTGRLKESIRALASQAGATVKAGSVGVGYAAAIEFGTGARPGKRGPHNIRGTRFLHQAAEVIEDGAAAVYAEQIDIIIKRAGL